MMVGRNNNETGQKNGKHQSCKLVAAQCTLDGYSDKAILPLKVDHLQFTVSTPQQLFFLASYPGSFRGEGESLGTRVLSFLALYLDDWLTKCLPF